MAAENSNKLILAKIENACQHHKENLYFSNPATFQHFKCNVSWENVGWKLRNLQPLYDWGSVMHTPSHTNVCKLFNCQLPFSQLILHLKCWNVAGLLKERCSFCFWYTFLRGSGWGVGKCQLLVKILSISHLSVKFWAICQLSVKCLLIINWRH